MNWLLGGVAIDTSAAPSRRVGKVEIVPADGENVSFVDALGIHLSTVEFDAVGAAQILEIVGSVVENNGRVLSRDIGILDGQVGGLGSPADDELRRGNRQLSPLKNQREGRPPSDATAGRRALLG